MKAASLRRSTGATALAFGLACAGCSGSSAEAPVPSFHYQGSSAIYRVGEAIAANAPTAESVLPAGLTITPPLPQGLELDPASGVITGAPLVAAAWETYTVRGLWAGSELTTTLELRVGPALPNAILWLDPDFAAEVVLEGLATPVKLALAPDGRLFFNELTSGDVQIIDPAGGLEPTPFASLAVESGDHRGLLGLALAPDFADSGHVFVMATFAADGLQPARGRVLRFTDQDGLGVDETVIVDDLPVADIDNGGELLFDATGHLLVSLGDTQDPAAAQDPGSLAGKILRYTSTGAIPPDNPDPASPVWCLGLRNTFALALHPTTGGVFGADNGPDTDDELNYLVAGRNFGWGYEGEGLGSEAGYTIRRWQEVIAPTALLFHDGAGTWSTHAGELFLASYTEENLRRIALTGVQATDFNSELPFLRFRPLGFSAKPLAMCQAPDGALYVSTFSGIYRVDSLR